MVPKAGLEPARVLPHTALNRARLPNSATSASCDDAESTTKPAAEGRASRAVVFGAAAVDPTAAFFGGRGRLFVEGFGLGQHVGVFLGQSADLR